MAWALEWAYRQDDRDIQQPLYDILDKTFHAGERAAQARARYSFDVLADNVEIVCGDGDLETRKRAARLIQPLKDQGSLVRLEALMAKPETPKELKDILEPNTLPEMRRVVGE